MAEQRTSVHPGAAGLDRIRIALHRPADGVGEIIAVWDDGQESIVGAVTRTHNEPGASRGWRASLWASHPMLAEGHTTWSATFRDLAKSLTESVKDFGPWWD